MARPGLLKHRKFIRLARILRSRYRAYGVLGLLWEAAYESGEPIVGDGDDVEALCDWDGEPGELVSAFQDCGGVGPGFIVQLDDGRFEVHDFWTHAPTYVRRRAEREVARQSAGLTLSEVRSAAGRLGVEAKRAKRQANGQSFATPCKTQPENVTAGNNRNSQANGKQVASTPSSQHPKTISAPALLGPVAAERVVVVPEKQEPSTSFQTTTTTPKTPRVSLGEREDGFLKFWNEQREKRGRHRESPTLDQLQALSVLVDEAHARDEERAEHALGELIVTFLDDEKFNRRTLNSIVKETVWRERLGNAFGKIDLEVRRAATRKHL